MSFATAAVRRLGNRGWKPTNHFSGPVGEIATSLRHRVNIGKPVNHAASAKTTADTPHYSAEPNYHTPISGVTKTVTPNKPARVKQLEASAMGEGADAEISPNFCFQNWCTLLGSCVQPTSLRKGLQCGCSHLFFSILLSKPFAAPTNL